MAEEKATLIFGCLCPRCCSSTSGMNVMNEKVSSPFHSSSCYPSGWKFRDRSLIQKCSEIRKVIRVSKMKLFFSLFMFQWTWLIETHSWQGQQRCCVKKPAHGPHWSSQEEVHTRALQWLALCGFWRCKSRPSSLCSKCFTHRSTPWGFPVVCFSPFFIWDSI